MPRELYMNEQREIPMVGAAITNDTCRGASIFRRQKVLPLKLCDSRLICLGRWEDARDPPRLRSQSEHK